MIIEEYMWAIWLGVFVLALVIEALSSELLSIWFAFGALVSTIISFIPGVEWWVELIVFLVVSSATLAFLRPIVSKYMKRNTVSSNIDEMIHKKGKIIKPCTSLEHGEVKINGVTWTAISSKEEISIDENALVEVLAVDGNKLIVREINKE